MALTGIFYRNRQSVFFAPPSFYAAVKSSPIYPEMPHPLNEGFLVTVNGNATVSAFVVSLFDCIRPFIVRVPAILKTFLALTARVMPVVTDAVNRRTFKWNLAHIQQKRGEVHPPLTDHNAATAISREPLDTGVKTPSLHPRPNGINRVVSTSVCEVTLTSVVFKPASATLRRTRPQGGSGNFCYLTAGTLTPPTCDVPLISSRKAQDAQAMILTPCNVFRSCSSWISDYYNVIFIKCHLIKGNCFNYLARATQSLTRLLSPFLLYQIGTLGAK